MKKIFMFFIVVSLVCFNGCGSSSKLSEMKNELSEDLFGIAYLGVCEEDFSEIIKYAEEKFPELDFIGKIDEEHFIQNEGYELYLIVPGENTEITVEHYSFDLNYNLVADKFLGKFTDGKPVLLRCNISDIVPNTGVSAERNGEIASYIPILSGMDGKLYETEEKVKLWHLF